MSSRPTEFSHRLLMASKIALALLWLIPLFYFFQLPDQVPTHFDGEGSPTSWTSKFNLFWLPVVGSALYGLFHYLNKRPAVFSKNNWWSTARNQAQLDLGREMMHILQLFTLSVFVYLVIGSILIARGYQQGLSSGFLNGFLFVLGICLVYYSVLYVKAGPESSSGRQ